MKKLISLFIISIFFVNNFYGQNQTIEGRFTCDNVFAIYKGDRNAIAGPMVQIPNWSGGINDSNDRGYLTGGSQLLNPPKFSFSASANDWFYIVAWSDDKSCQGLIGEFKGDRTLKTGDPGWEVFATGLDKDGLDDAPTVDIINEQISLANSSNAWTSPFVGGRNVNTKNVCNAEPGWRTFTNGINGISPVARWVWFDSKDSTNPFTSAYAGHNQKEFLIFRFPINNVIGRGSSDSTFNFDPAVCSCICDVFKLNTVSGRLDPSRLGSPAIPNSTTSAGPSTTGTDIQFVDLPLYHFYVTTENQSNGQNGLTFSFKPDQSLKSILENYLKEINKISPCIDQLTLWVRVNDVTGTNGTPDNTVVGQDYITLNLISGNIVYSSGTQHVPSPWNRPNGVILNQTPLPIINKDYKVAFSAWLASSAGNQCNFKCTNLFAYQYRYPIFVPMKKENKTIFTNQIKDINGKVIKELSITNNSISQK